MPNLSELFGVKPRPPYAGGKPTQDPAYLKFLRSLPCVICFSSRNVEAAHTGPHGIGQKSCDYSCIPLCRQHHTVAADSYHKLGQARFVIQHNLDLPTLIAYFKHRYERRHA